MTAEQIAEIQARYSAGESTRKLAAAYAVGKSLISRITSGHHWATSQAAAAPDRSLARRYWRRVIKVEGDGCWEWAGAHSPAGYGRIGLQGKRIEYAHRVGWELTYGPLESGEWVLHRCDNPGCQRPDHWFKGGPLENVRDMIAKGRARNHWPPGHPFIPRKTSFAGERNPAAKLTTDEVAEIRQRYTGAHGEQRRFGREYGVSATMIGYIVRGMNWPV